MAETRYSIERSTGYSGKRYTQSFFGGIDFMRIFRFVFFVILAFLLVYTYYLYSKGILQETILRIWSTYQRELISLSVFIAYSTIIFRLGVWKGRKS